SRDGTRIATASYDQSVRVWDARSGKQLNEFRGHVGRVVSVAWNADGTRLSSAGLQDWSVRIWNVDSPDRPGLVLRGHGGQVGFVSYSPDGSRIASAASDGTFKIWDSNIGPETDALRGHEAEVISIDWSPDGNQLVSGDGKGRIILWDPH